MSEPYQWLSQYYDELFLPVRPPIDAAREHILAHILPSVKKACDIACGTGTTAVTLARRGIRTYAVDISSRMCSLTREKARREGVSVRVFRGDMRSFRLPDLVDLVVCEYDAINHIPHRDDLRKVSRIVQHALRPGGHFLFDVNNAAAFKRYWRDTFMIERPGVVLTMRNGHTPQLDRAWAEIDLFVKEGQHWLRHHERVEEVCWSSQEIQTTFRDAGFDQLRAWDAAQFWKTPPLKKGSRTIYLARKAER